MAFTAMTLPKVMRFKPPKGADWFAEYAWVAFPESNMPSAEVLNADLSQVSAKENRSANTAGGAAASVRQKSNLRQRAGSTSKSVKFDAGTVQAEEGGPAAGPAKKQLRPKSAVKGKSGKVLPRAANKPNPNKGSEEQTVRKRGMPKLEPEEEEVKLSPEEIYEIEMQEAQERTRLETEEKRAMLLAKQR